MSITLPPDIEEFIHKEVASGRFESADDLLHEAINILKQRESQRDALRKDIGAAVKQIENGDYFEYDDTSLHGFLDELKQEAQQQASP